MPSEIAAPIQPGVEPGQGRYWPTLRAAHAAILAVTAYRVVLAFFDRTELSTDEAQYWYWGQTFAFGAYSKPPLIGWIMRISADLMGQTVASVRLPAALFHGATAAVLLHLAARLFAWRVAVVAAVSYLTMPAVALGSALMTTDTPMLLAAAVAMTSQVGLAEARMRGEPARGLALVLGLSLGTGLLAKHAMLFWIAGAIAAAWLSPRFRVRASDAALAAGVMLAVILPHLLWLVRHDFVTLRHVQDITRGDTLSVLRPLAFLAQQAVVVGPVLLLALLLAAVSMRRDAGCRGLAALAIAPVAIVLVQAVKGPVLANWAVLYLLPGSLLAAAWLARWPRLTGLSMAMGLAVTLALPVVKVFGTGLRAPNDTPLLARYVGHGEPAIWAIATAKAAGGETLVAQARSLMADLSWFGEGQGLVLKTVPPKGRPRNHWEAVAAFDPDTDPGPVLLLTSDGQPPGCGPTVKIGRFAAPPGAYGGRQFELLLLAAPHCLGTRDTDDD